MQTQQIERRLARQLPIVFTTKDWSVFQLQSRTLHYPTVVRDATASTNIRMGLNPICLLLSNCYSLRFV